MEIKIKLMDNCKTPTKQHKDDACYDCYSAENMTIKSGRCGIVKLGFALEIPSGYMARIEDRSGLASIGVFTTGGIIDSNYRGEVKAIIQNFGYDDFDIHFGDRICQMGIEKVIDVDFIQVDELSETDRNANGFGSTGK